jgi:PadR family transcriptional regulator, regulatory protein PadR
MAEVLGTFEQAILLALVRLGDDAYGRAILKDVQERLERDVAAGAVYATLDRLEQRALISSHLAEGTVVRAGRPRRYYSIEKAGVRALNSSRAAVDNIWQGFRWPLKGKA